MWHGRQSRTLERNKWYLGTAAVSGSNTIKTIIEKICLILWDRQILRSTVQLLMGIQNFHLLWLRFFKPSSGPLFCFFALKVISNQISLLIQLTVSWCLQQKLIPSEIGLSLQSYFQWIIEVTNLCDFWYISDCADFVKGDKDKHLRVKVCLSGSLLRFSTLPLACPLVVKVSSCLLFGFI